MGKLINLLLKNGESYGEGSSGIDFLSTMDGSETSQRDINTYEPSNGDGQGRTPAGGHANHPVTPLGEQGHEQPHEDDTTPFNEAVVDDNHANNDGGVSAGLIRFFIKTADETNFFLEHSTAGGVADSPQTMEKGYKKNEAPEGGHPREELEEQEGVNSVINAPHPTNEADQSILRDKGLVDKSQAAKDRVNTTPDINKGRNVSSGFYPFMRTSVWAQVKRPNPDTDYKNESNVSDVMYSQEEAAKADRVKHDFGTGDQMSDGITMEVAPLGDENYSGRENSTAGLLRFFTKHADYAGVIPSVNPNSGRDNDADDVSGNAMTDGKGDFNNTSDKLMIDPARYRKQMQYNRNKVEDDDEERHYQYLGTGGGFGGEANGPNQSGVDNT